MLVSMPLKGIPNIWGGVLFSWKRLEDTCDQEED